jgi:hypothetical protein
VTALGGTNADGTHFLIPVAEAIDFITTGRFAFYIEQSGTTRTEIRVVRPKNGRPYLRTVADGSSPNNLDQMPEGSHV